MSRGYRNNHHGDLIEDDSHLESEESEDEPQDVVERRGGRSLRMRGNGRESRAPSVNVHRRSTEPRGEGSQQRESDDGESSNRSTARLSTSAPSVPAQAPQGQGAATGSGQQDVLSGHNQALASLSVQVWNALVSSAQQAQASAQQALLTQQLQQSGILQLLTQGQQPATQNNNAPQVSTIYPPAGAGIQQYQQQQQQQSQAATPQQQQQLLALSAVAQIVNSPVALQQLGALLQRSAVPAPAPTPSQPDLVTLLGALLQNPAAGAAPTQQQQSQGFNFSAVPSANNPFYMIPQQYIPTASPTDASQSFATQSASAARAGDGNLQANIARHLAMAAPAATAAAAPAAAQAPRNRQEEDGKPVKRRRYNHEAFPSKLHRLICDAEKEGKDHIIRFINDGTQFQIFDTAAFEEEILPRYFRHGNIKSFSRLLRMYAFRRIQGTWTEGKFEHEKFRRDAPKLCRDMERVETKYGSMY